MFFLYICSNSDQTHTNSRTSSASNSRHCLFSCCRPLARSLVRACIRSSGKGATKSRLRQTLRPSPAEAVLETGRRLEPSGEEVSPPPPLLFSTPRSGERSDGFIAASLATAQISAVLSRWLPRNLQTNSGLNSRPGSIFINRYAGSA